MNLHKSAIGYVFDLCSGRHLNVRPRDLIQLIIVCSLFCVLSECCRCVCVGGGEGGNSWTASEM